LGSDLIISMLLFTIIGVIVSMDVAGLTISKTEQLAAKPYSVVLWCISNALWHAGLLALYLLAINGILTISPEYIRLIEQFFSYAWQQLQFLPNGLLLALQYATAGLKLHTNVILGVIALAVVWRIYSKKIVDSPSEGQISDLPLLARFAFNVLDIVSRAIGRRKISPKRLQQFLHDQAQAALVAVDMLALAILLKSTNSIQGVVEGCLVVGIVFVVVLTITYATASAAMDQFSTLQDKSLDVQRHSVRSLHWVRITLRLGEPFLIFYFVLQLVSLLLLGEQSQGVSLFFGAGVLVWALIDKFSLPTVVKSSLAKARAPSEEQNTVRSFKQILWDLTMFLAVCAAAMIALPFALLIFSLLAWITSFGSAAPLAFDEQLSRVVGLLTVLSAGTFAPRLFQFTWLEDRLIKGINFLMANRRTFVFMAAAMFMATVFPVYDQLIDEARRAGTRPDLGGVRDLLQPNHKHVLQVGIWFALFVAIGTCLDRAERKFQVALGDLAQKPQVLKLYGWWLYSGVLTLIGLLLVLVGYLQGLITN
jgi:uncharacterized membrane protein